MHRLCPLNNQISTPSHATHAARHVNRILWPLIFRFVVPTNLVLLNIPLPTNSETLSVAEGLLHWALILNLQQNCLGTCMYAYALCRNEIDDMCRIADNIPISFKMH